MDDVAYAEKIQAERDRLEAENARLLAPHDGHGAPRTSHDGNATPSPSNVRDKPSVSAKHAPERAASHKEPSGRLTEAGPTHKDVDSAKEKAIAERRLRELAVSGFRKRARSTERSRLEPSQRARDPTPPRKERRRTSRSRSQTRSRDRQRPRSPSACSPGPRVISGCPGRLQLGHHILLPVSQLQRWCTYHSLCLTLSC